MQRIQIIIILILIPFFSISQDYSTWGEIYNYDIGDVFHVEELKIVEQDTLLMKSVIEIADKNLSANLDTVFYNQYIQTLKYTSVLQDWVYESYNEEVSYTKLDSLYFSDTTYYSTLYNGRKISYIIRTVNYPFNNTVFKRYVDGCGLVYYSYYQHMPYDLEKLLNLVYFRKGNEEWGDPLQFLGIEDLGNETGNCVVFPNPAKDKIQISSMVINQIDKVHIYNNMGKLVFNQSSSFDNINISSLSPGLYIIQIHGNNWRVNRKLIVK